MKVIIIEDDRVENVSDGYARNYLLPKKLAILATRKALVAMEKRKEKRKASLDKRRAELQGLANQLAATELDLKADAGDEGKLFGSITTSDISGAIKNLLGAEIDKRKIDIKEPIKFLGEYKVAVKLFQDIKATLKIKVSPK